jgi:hypothetical protein
MTEDTDMEDVMARANRRTDEQLQQEERERGERECYEREQREGRYARLDCGEVRTHITAGEVEEILKALADRIDAAHSRPVTEGRPEGIERAYAAYEKLYTVRREQHYRGVPFSPSERLIYQRVEMTCRGLRGA